MRTITWNPSAPSTRARASRAATTSRSTASASRARTSSNNAQVDRHQHGRERSPASATARPARRATRTRRSDQRHPARRALADQERRPDRHDARRRRDLHARRRRSPAACATTTSRSSISCPTACATPGSSTRSCLSGCPPADRHLRAGQRHSRHPGRERRHRAAASSSATSSPAPVGDDRVLRIHYSAHLDDMYVNPATPVSAGDDLTNHAGVFWNQTDTITTPPTTRSPRHRQLLDQRPHRECRRQASSSRT